MFPQTPLPYSFPSSRAELFVTWKFLDPEIVWKLVHLSVVPDGEKMWILPLSEEKVFRGHCPGNTLSSFSLCWRQHSSRTWFSKPFTVISKVTQHPCGACAPFRGSTEISCCLRSPGQRLAPNPFLRCFRDTYMAKSLEMETESLFSLDLSLNWRFYTYLLSLVIKWGDWIVRPEHTRKQDCPFVPAPPST